MPSQTLLSTRKVAELLSVAETTIKRWADEETLACVKTPGGHRKFVTSEVLAFAEKHQYPLTGLLPPPMAQKEGDRLQLGVQTRDFTLLAGVFLEKALLGDRHGLYELLNYVYTHQIPYSSIVDDIVRPAMEAVGERWSKGVLEINQEHRATQATLEALLRLGPELHRKPSNGLTAVCSCVEGEQHSIGLQCVADGLESEGWAVHTLGANTPFDSLRSYVKRIRPDLVCLSSTVERRRKDFAHSVRVITETVRSWNGVVMLGGSIANHQTAEALGCDFAPRSLQETLTFARDHFQLKPGPKKSQLATMQRRKK